MSSGKIGAGAAQSNYTVYTALARNARRYTACTRCVFEAYGNSVCVLITTMSGSGFVLARASIHSRGPPGERNPSSGIEDEMTRVSLLTFVLFSAAVPVLVPSPVVRAGNSPVEPSRRDRIAQANEVPQAVTATPKDRLQLLPGFRAELLYSVPLGEQGSRVSTTIDPRGRLIASDQYGKLYRITPPPIGSRERIVVEELDVEIGMAHGLLCAFDCLYVMVNESDEVDTGLYRVRDTDGDDDFDSIELLWAIPGGGGEHGLHAVIPGPDGASLYLCCGNNTNLSDRPGPAKPNTSYRRLHCR